MKLTIDAKVLAAAAADAAKALPRNAHHPILNCLRLAVHDGGVVELGGFDYDTSVVVRLPDVDPDVDDADAIQSVLLPGRALAQFAARLKGEVTLEVDGSTATLGAGRTKITLHTLPADDYPALPDPLPPVLTVDGAALAAAVAAVLPAVSTDPGLPALLGIQVCAEGGLLTFAATDRYTIAHRTVELDPTVPGVHTALLPGKVLSDVVKGITGPVSIGLDEHGASIATPDRTVTLRALAGEFPDVARFLTVDPSTTVDVDRADLRDALDLARAASDDRNVPVILDVLTDGVDYRRGDDEQQLLGSIDATVTGDGLRIGIKPDYLADIARAVTGERITLGMTTARKPVYVTTDDAVHLCMPIALPAVSA